MYLTFDKKCSTDWDMSIVPMSSFISNFIPIEMNDLIVVRVSDDISLTVSTFGTGLILHLWLLLFKTLSRLTRNDLILLSIPIVSFSCSYSSTSEVSIPWLTISNLIIKLYPFNTDYVVPSELEANKSSNWALPLSIFFIMLYALPNSKAYISSEL